MRKHKDRPATADHRSALHMYAPSFDRSGHRKIDITVIGVISIPKRKRHSLMCAMLVLEMDDVRRGEVRDGALPMAIRVVVVYAVDAAEAVLGCGC